MYAGVLRSFFFFQRRCFFSFDDSELNEKCVKFEKCGKNELHWICVCIKITVSSPHFNLLYYSSIFTVSTTSSYFFSSIFFLGWEGRGKISNCFIIISARTLHREEDFDHWWLFKKCFWMWYTLNFLLTLEPDPDAKPSTVPHDCRDRRMLWKISSGTQFVHWRYILRAY